MKYDFQTIVDRRNVGAFKWEEMRRIDPTVGDDIVPLSVADMEFKNPPEIIEGLKHYLDGAVLGYTEPTCLLYTSPSPRDRQKSRMPSSA